jgi:hypothetical protein
MRLLPALVFFVTSSMASGCGGSASETPFPEEPLPDYLTLTATPAQASAPKAEPSAKPTDVSVQLGGGVQARPPARPTMWTGEDEPSKSATPAGSAAKPASAPAF